MSELNQEHIDRETAKHLSKAEKKRLNVDLLSGETGAHPLGTGIGTGGGAAAGAVGGPIGALVGGAVARWRSDK